MMHRVVLISVTVRFAFFLKGKKVNLWELLWNMYCLSVHYVLFMFRLVIFNEWKKLIKMRENLLTGK